MALFRRTRRRGDPDLLDADLFLATVGEPAGPTGWRITDERETFDIRVVDNEDGLTFVPLFTSEEALARWLPEGSPYICLRGHDALAIFLDTGHDAVAIDLGSDGALALSREDVSRLLGVTTHHLGPGATMNYGLPAREPSQGLLDELAAACARVPEITEAYVFQSEVPPHKPELAIGLVVDRPIDDREPLLRSLGIEPSRWGYSHFAYWVLEDDLLEWARASAPRAYARAG
jgi:hypothetical protein